MKGKCADGPLLPPPLAAAICALLMWGASESMPNMNLDYALRWPLTLAAAALGGCFAFAGIATIMLARTTVNPLTPCKAARLVTHGVYRLSRNPIYVGDALLLGAFALWLGNPLAALPLPLFLLWIDRFQIRPEEAALAGLFGEEYEEYRRRVRRWL